MAREVVTRCDMNPNDTEGVSTYTIRTDGQAWEVDLCEKHAEPIKRLIAKGRKTAEASRGRDMSKTLEAMVRNPPS